MLGLVTICAVVLGFGLILDAVMNPAQAGKVCNRLDLTSPCIAGSDIKANAITSGKVENGRLTGTDIKDGTIQFKDLAHDAVFMRTIVVSPVGPKASDNCNELRAALADITDNAADNPYMIKLEPGTYDCGNTSLVMKEFVDIEGSGREITKIHGITSSAFGVVRLADHTELRHLSVTNLGGTENTVIAIDAAGAENFRLTDVSATALGATGSSSAIVIGSQGEVVLKNVDALADSNSLVSIGIAVTGVNEVGVNMILSDVKAEGRGSNTNVGLNVSMPTTTKPPEVVVMNSRITGLGSSVSDSHGVVYIANSQLVGPANGTPKCVNAFDENFDPLDELCQ